MKSALASIGLLTVSPMVANRIFFQSESNILLPVDNISWFYVTAIKDERSIEPMLYALQSRLKFEYKSGAIFRPFTKKELPVPGAVYGAKVLPSGLRYTEGYDINEDRVLIRLDAAVIRGLAQSG